MSLRAHAQALSLVLATAASAMGNTTLSVALASMAQAMGATVLQASWAMTLFSAASALGFALTGWLSQRLGSNRLYVMSVAVFSLASGLCALVPALPMLLALRVVQGLAAGPMASVSLALMLSAFPAARAGTATALWGLAGLLAPVAGPLVGGVLVDLLSWRWLFAVNLPLGLLALALFARSRQVQAPGSVPVPLDGRGLALLVAAVAGLVALVDASRPGVRGPVVLAWALATAATLGLLVRHARACPHPIIALGLLRQAPIGRATGLTAACYALYAGHMALMPVWLQRSLGYTATEVAGILALAGLSALAAAPAVGRWIGRGDPRWPMGAATLLMVLVSWMRAGWVPGVALQEVLLASVLQGAATSMIFIPMTGLALSGQTGHQAAAASGLYNFARACGGALGIAATLTLWEALHKYQLAQLGDSGQAWARASSDLFRLTGALFLALLPVVIGVPHRPSNRR